MNTVLAVLLLLSHLSPTSGKYYSTIVLYNVNINALRKHPHMFYTPSFTLLYSRKGEMRGTQIEVYFLVLTRMVKEGVIT